MKLYPAILFVLLGILPRFQAAGQAFTYQVDPTFNPQDKGDGSDDYLQTTEESVGLYRYSGTNTGRFMADGNIVLTNFQNDTLLRYRSQPLSFLTRLTGNTAPAPGFATWLLPAMRPQVYDYKDFVARTNRSFVRGQRLIVSDQRPTQNGIRPVRGIRPDGTEDTALSNIVIPGQIGHYVYQGYLPTGELYLSYSIQDSVGDRYNKAIIFPPGDTGLPVTVTAPISGFDAASPTLWDRDEQGRVRQLQLLSNADRLGGIVRMHTFEPTTSYEQDMVFLQADGSDPDIDITIYKNAQIFPVAEGKFLLAYTRHSTPNRIATAGSNAIVVHRYHYEGTFDNTFATITIPLPELDSIKTKVLFNIVPYPDGKGYLFTARREEYYWTPNFHEKDFWLARRITSNGFPYPGSDFSFVARNKATLFDIGPGGQALFLAPTTPWYPNWYDLPTPTGYELILADSLGHLLPVAQLSGGFNSSVNSMALREGTTTILAGGPFSQVNGKRTGAIARFDAMTGQVDSTTQYNGSMPMEVYVVKDGTSFVMGPRGEFVKGVASNPTVIDIRSLTRRLRADLSVDSAGPVIENGVVLADKSFISYVTDTSLPGPYAYYLKHYNAAGIRVHGPSMVGHRMGSGPISFMPRRDTTFLFLQGQSNNSHDLKHMNADLTDGRIGGRTSYGYALGNDGSVIFHNLYIFFPFVDTLMRLGSHLQLDTSFHGKINGSPVASLPDGSALVLAAPGLIRLLPNGSIDPNFSPIAGLSPKALATDDGRYVYLYGSFLGTFGGKPSSRVMRLVRTQVVANEPTTALVTLRLRPNPARTSVWVEAQGATQATLFGLDGRPLKNQLLSDGKGRLSLAGLPKGLYLVKAGIAVERLVVE